MDGLDRGADDLSRADRAGRRLGRPWRRHWRHWLFTTLLILATALRAVVLVAYHPALIFPDSVRYLQYAHNFTVGQWSADALRQSGYSILIILVWRRERPRQRPRDRPGETQETRTESWLPAAACGLLLGLAVTFRDEVLIMIVPATLYVLVAVRPWRRLLIRMAALTGCFLIPVIGYLGSFDASHGEWNFSTFSGAFLYGRVADFASLAAISRRQA